MRNPEDIQNQTHLEHWEIYSRGLLLAVLYDRDAADAAFEAISHKHPDIGLVRFHWAGEPYTIQPPHDSMESMIADVLKGR